MVDLIIDRLTLGTFVDFLEGKLLDFMLGTDDLGDVVGRLELTFDGVLLGLRVGLTEGVVAFTVGALVFTLEGKVVGLSLGTTVFIIEGDTLDFVVGTAVFVLEGDTLVFLTG